MSRPSLQDASAIPLGPSIADASQTSALFQTEDAIADGLRRREKKERQLGDPIELPTKILCMTLAPRASPRHLIIEHRADGMCAQTGKTAKIYKGHAGPVTSVAAFYRYAETAPGVREKKELLLSGSWDKTLCLWDAQTKEPLLTLRGHTDFIKAIALGKDHLAGGQDGHPTTAYSVSADGTARRWSLETGACLAVYENEHRGQIESVTVTVGPDPTLDEAQAATAAIREWLWTAGTDGTVRCWDIDTGRCVATLSGHATSIFAVHASTSDGSGSDLWTASADKTARRWDLATCSEDTSLEHPAAVRSVHTVGPYVVTGCRDEHVRVFDVASGQLVATLEGHFDEIMSIAAHNGVLYTASLDSTIRRWPIADIASGKYAQSDAAAPAGEEEAAAPRDSLLTEEEERELAELLGDSDADE
ncbi:WD40-repeat-containing domain protein [Syncephalis pseudoplumigaleata]|uniref:WD40-repeat-containing domain protein n=1 Tax=Syncephalis pseudoplumigaleata TaxID=1712513 RepID=A0A4P9YWX6_9FUNG|nr:WD40-repeat-containing domain protein [Syncephalis pseudoplumigaleata]|eukprot:RKP23460.1 WD40-repeat-containing domain protein [Syncephalis pseudoplumigaleata]